MQSGVFEFQKAHAAILKPQIGVNRAVHCGCHAAYLAGAKLGSFDEASGGKNPPKTPFRENERLRGTL
jgi:hypothetical protein